MSVVNPVTWLWRFFLDWRDRYRAWSAADELRADLRWHELACTAEGMDSHNARVRAGMCRSGLPPGRPCSHCAVDQVTEDLAW